MSEGRPITIAAEVAQSEREAVTIGAALLADALRAAVPDRPLPVHCSFVPGGGGAGAGQRSDLLIVSLLAELDEPEEPRGAAHVRLAAALRDRQERAAHVFVTTIPRHVPRRARGGVPDAKLTRIRMFNLIAADLSHELGVNVIDLDRAVAHLGARGLRTDYRLAGEAAAQVAGHAIASAILGANPDDVIAPELVEAAQAALSRG